MTLGFPPWSKKCLCLVLAEMRSQVYRELWFLMGVQCSSYKAAMLVSSWSAGQCHRKRNMDDPQLQDTSATRLSTQLISALPTRGATRGGGQPAWPADGPWPLGLPACLHHRSFDLWPEPRPACVAACLAAILVVAWLAGCLLSPP